MRIKWENIIPLILIGLLIFVAVKITPLFTEIFEEIDDIHTYGPGRIPMKLLFVALICVTIVVTAKFMSRR